MCLITKDIKPLIATEDIVCYKVLEGEGTNIFSKYKTPYVERPCFPFLLAALNFPFIAFDEKVIIKRDYGYLIGKGYIHTYSSKVSLDTHSSRVKVFKCIIPKGTFYYRDEDSYASEKINFLCRIQLWIYMI